MAGDVGGVSFDWLMPLLEKAGIPTGICALIVIGTIGADRILRRFAVNSREEGESNRAERVLLSTEQASFRASLMAQLEQQAKVIDALQADLQISADRCADADRRVVDFQMTIARMAASLIRSGLTLPTATLAEIGMAAPPAGSGPA